MPITTPLSPQEIELKLINSFSNCKSDSQFHEKILHLGKSFTSTAKEEFSDENRVSGCQSLMYCKVIIGEDHRVEVKLWSDALISKGLASMLVTILNHQCAKNILLFQPSFSEKLKLDQRLSLGRLQGVSTLLLQIKKEIISILS